MIDELFLAPDLCCFLVPPSVGIWELKAEALGLPGGKASRAVLGRALWERSHSRARAAWLGTLGELSPSPLPCTPTPGGHMQFRRKMFTIE